MTSCLTAVSYSDDLLDYDYSSPYGYRDYNRDLFNFGRQEESFNSSIVSSPITSSAPVSTRSPPTPTPRNQSLEITLSPDILFERLLNIDDLLVDFENEREYE